MSFVSSASQLVGLQAVSRLFTFALNQALLRLVSPQAFGTAAVQFELLLSTILFLSREGVRNALLRAWTQRAPADGKAKVAGTIANLTLLPIAFGLPMALGAAQLYRASCAPTTRAQPHFDLAIALYALAAFVELLSEPLHIRTMGELRTGIRVKAEGLGVIAKSIITFLVLFYENRHGSREGELALLAFALGQLAYAFSVLTSYRLQYGAVPFWPTRNLDAPNTWGGYFDPTYLRLSLTMTSQSVLKHLLTEGDKFVVSRLSPLKDQGGYALASNYGSLVARIVFQPIEEMSRIFFSRTLSAPASTTSATPEPEPRSQTQDQHGAARFLQTLLSVQTNLAVILVALAPPFLPPVLRVLLPARYLGTSAPALLAAWVWYIPLLALNGVLEAFIAGAATPADLNRQSRWMALFSVVYALAAGAFYALGLRDTALVYANMVNLSARIVYAAFFISAFFRARGQPFAWRAAAPTWRMLLIATLAGAAVRYSARALGVSETLERHGRGALLEAPLVKHFTQGVGMGIICLGVFWGECGQHVFHAVRPASGPGKEQRKHTKAE